MKIEFTKILVIKHLLGWVMIISIFQIITGINYTLPILLLRAFIELIIFMTPYYLLSAFILPYYHYHNKGKALFYGLLSLILYICSYYLLEFGVYAILNNESLTAPEPIWVMSSTIYYILIFLLADSFYKNQITKQKMIKVNLQELISINQEILFFKNQFNNHVSFNFLNYCHKHFLNTFENGAKAIEVYEKMLESTLSIGSSNTISLDLEIQYLEQFIYLQHLVSKKEPIRIEKKGDFKNFNILPRILITFVENAYKYGITSEKEKPLIINMELQDQDLHFKIANYKKKNTNSIISTSIGQINAKQQLDLYYQNNYSILVDENELSYQVYLKIKLKRR